MLDSKLSANIAICVSLHIKMFTESSVDFTIDPIQPMVRYYILIIVLRHLTIFTFMFIVNYSRCKKVMSMSLGMHLAKRKNYCMISQAFSASPYVLKLHDCSILMKYYWEVILFYNRHDHIYTIPHLLQICLIFICTGSSCSIQVALADWMP